MQQDIQQDSIDIEYLKNNITEDQFLLLYWYIINNEDNFSKDQLAHLYELLYEIDDKLKETDNGNIEDDTVHT